jgi:hypothetical protein
VYRKIAAKHFPDREITGDGQWLLLSECVPESPVMLFPVESQRQAVLNLWVNGNCGAALCRGAHFAKRIKPQPEYVWERDRD